MSIFKLWPSRIRPKLLAQQQPAHFFPHNPAVSLPLSSLLLTTSPDLPLPPKIISHLIPLLGDRRLAMDAANSASFLITRRRHIISPFSSPPTNHRLPAAIDLLLSTTAAASFPSSVSSSPADLRRLTSVCRQIRSLLTAAIAVFHLSITAAVSVQSSATHRLSLLPPLPQLTALQPAQHHRQTHLSATKLSPLPLSHLPPSPFSPSLCRHHRLYLQSAAVSVLSAATAEPPLIPSPLRLPSPFSPSQLTAISKSVLDYRPKSLFLPNLKSFVQTAQPSAAQPTAPSPFLTPSPLTSTSPSPRLSPDSLLSTVAA